MILSPRISILAALLLASLTAACGALVAGRGGSPDRAGAHGSAPTPLAGGFTGPMPADVLRIIDGDTFQAQVQVWFGQEVRSAIRIRGFDAPELHAGCADEKKMALAATDMLRDILASGPVTLHDIAPDKYFGRVVATVHVRLSDGGETDVAQMMLAAGHGRPYAGGKRGAWC